MTIPISPLEQVQAQLARQKWAVDTRDAQALAGLYTPDSAQVIYQGGPDGRREIARSRGRDEIIAGIVAGWERTAATWYPGALIHQIGSVLAEPAADGRIRCRCYASVLALDAAGTAALRGYLSYDDIWALDAGEWRLAYRETVMYGYPLSRVNKTDLRIRERAWASSMARSRSSPAPRAGRAAATR